MTKWEYETTAFPELAAYHSILDYIAAMHEGLSEMGGDGWELVTVIYDTAIFKRPVMDCSNYALDDYDAAIEGVLEAERRRDND